MQRNSLNKTEIIYMLPYNTKEIHENIMNHGLEQDYKISSGYFLLKT